MEIKNIQLTNFRNYDELSLEFSDGINVLIGPNAQGKTNLLEAIYFLGLTRSHRAQSSKELIEWQKDFTRVAGEIKKETGTVSLEIQVSKQGKIAKVNNLTSPKISEYIGQLNVVLFAPEDLELVKGSPSVRRKFLDSEFGQMSSEYLFNFLSFNAVLKNRNSYLKTDTQIFDEDYLNVLDEQLISYGSKIIKKRFELIDQLNQISKLIHLSIAENENLNISYKTFKNIHRLSTISEIEDEFRIQLQKNRRREEVLQSTQVGPQRDDLLFFVNDREASSFASQGQQRTIALSIRLAEIQLSKEQTGEYPILLLDDVFSELDATRQTHLITYIQDKVQTFITTPSLNDINQELINAPKIFQVREGEITNG
jgi:DNA replication and repair protein RecF